MRIVIIANFTRDFSETDNGRFLYLAKLLAAQGHRVELITNDFNHGRKERRGAVSTELPFTVTLLHEPGYRRNVSLQRFMSHRAWGKNLRAYLETMEKPDVVYCAVPSLSGPAFAASYCEKNGVRFMVDIQDLWPEAFQMVLNVPWLFAPLHCLANSIYSRADAICAVSQAYVDRALRVNTRCKKGTVAFLGTDLGCFDSYAAKTPLLPREPGKLRLAYCGALSASYDLECMFQALSLLKDRGIDLQCVIMGDGAKRAAFEQSAKEKQLDAVFTGRLPYDRMCAQLCACDIAVNPITRNAAQSIINKHGDYAASGLPVLNTQESAEYRRLIEEYNMGFNCRNNDPSDLAEKLETLVRDPELRKRMGLGARRCAEERFDRKRSYQALAAAILSGQKEKTV